MTICLPISPLGPLFKKKKNINSILKRFVTNLQGEGQKADGRTISFMIKGDRKRNPKRTVNS